MEKKEETCYTNRELSWLAFNERVLNEASNEKVPLAERLTFASIYQTNLDEFYMVRVGTLMTQMNSKEKICENKTGMSSEKQVAAILKKTRQLEKKKAVIYEQLMGELEPKGVRIINFNKLSNQEGKFLEEYFDVHIAPFLSPMIIGKQHPFPFLANKQMYAVVLLTTPKGKNKIGIVPCKNMVFKRLIEIPTRPGTFMLSEELILHFISKLYSKYRIREKAIMRVTRNADIDAYDVYDEDLDYRDVMEHLIKKRNRLSPVRIELSREINDKAKAELSNYLEIGKGHFINVDTPLDLSYVFELQNYLADKPELFYEKRSPRNPAGIDLKTGIIEQIEQKDRLLSYPFESMKPFIKMLEEAAVDEKVVSIKMTLYRVAERSKIIDALVEAAENGKEVVVLIELRARFDEANNIEMSKRLEEAGCQILYGLGEYKVHSKLCLITKTNEASGFSYVTQIGTGNYNEKTSRLYTDLSLMTANQDIGIETAKVFDALQKGETVETTSGLLVAPHCLQNRIVGMIDEQIQIAKAGGDAYIGVKVNSLTDKAIIDKFIEASNAGVKIDLIVRGICCLKPKVLGYTENIRVISIVGRFLEHSRIYIFGQGAQQKIYIASADFMTRNTIRRVEVAVPIYDEDIKRRIRSMFELMLSDDEKGKEQNADGLYLDRKVNEVPIDSQEEFYRQAYEAAECMARSGQ
ncbi:MAG: polyphosphate kinase 1 [Lachnospiraceae bacterium]|nr:polyphosphate kinase 1 [Lachnospiraceae bacterium]